MALLNKIKKIKGLIYGKEKIAVPSVQGIETLLQGKVALITGGSGGIGSAIAEKLLSAGCKVIIAGTNEEKLAAFCSKHSNNNVKSIILNLNNIKSIGSTIESAVKLFEEDKIDILVNCAGYNPRKGFFDITQDDYDKTFNINVKGTFFMCQKMADYMIRNQIKGHILNISSSSALRPAWSPYEMSKWTIRGLTIGLADALIPHGIVVNALAPGPTATPMLDKSAKDDLDLPSSPVKRYSTPEEIANLALVLVSDLGNLIVGDTIYATGGSGVISLHR